MWTRKLSPVRGSHENAQEAQKRGIVFEPSCGCLVSRRDGGAEGIRTPDPHNAIVVLYQLSYDPIQSGRNLGCRA